MGIRAWKSRICSFFLFPLQVYVVSGNRVMAPGPSKQQEAQECLTSSGLAGSQCHQCATRLGHPRWGVLSTGCACPYSLSHGQHLSHLQLEMLDSSPAFRRLLGQTGVACHGRDSTGSSPVPPEWPRCPGTWHGWRERDTDGVTLSTKPENEVVQGCAYISVILCLLCSLCEHLAIPRFPWTMSLM